MAPLGTNFTAESCYTIYHIQLTKNPDSLQTLINEMRVNRTWIDDCNEMSGGGKDFHNRTKQGLYIEARETVLNLHPFWSLGNGQRPNISRLSPAQQDFLTELREAAGSLEYSFYQSPWLGGALGGTGFTTLVMLKLLPTILELRRVNQVSFLRAFLASNTPALQLTIVAGIAGIFCGAILAASTHERYPTFNSGGVSDYQNVENPDLGETDLEGGATIG